MLRTIEQNARLSSRRTHHPAARLAVSGDGSARSQHLGRSFRLRPAGASHDPSRHFHDPALLQRDPPVHAAGKLQVVGGDDRGEARGAHELRERLKDVLGGARVEIAGRLVGEQDARRVGDRARDRDALLLAAGKLAGRWSAAPSGRDSRAARRARLRASLRDRPRIICGSITFSSAENSGSR